MPITRPSCAARLGRVAQRVLTPERGLHVAHGENRIARNVPPPVAGHRAAINVVAAAAGDAPTIQKSTVLPRAYELLDGFAAGERDRMRRRKATLRRRPRRQQREPGSRTFSYSLLPTQGLRVDGQQSLQPSCHPRLLLARAYAAVKQKIGHRVQLTRAVHQLRAASEHTRDDVSIARLPAHFGAAMFGRKTAVSKPTLRKCRTLELKPSTRAKGRPDRNRIVRRYGPGSGSALQTLPRRFLVGAAEASGGTLVMLQGRGPPIARSLFTISARFSARPASAPFSGILLIRGLPEAVSRRLFFCGSRYDRPKLRSRPKSATCQATEAAAPAEGRLTRLNTLMQ